LDCRPQTSLAAVVEVSNRNDLATTATGGKAPKTFGAREKLTVGRWQKKRKK